MMRVYFYLLLVLWKGVEMFLAVRVICLVTILLLWSWLQKVKFNKSGAQVRGARHNVRFWEKAGSCWVPPIATMVSIPMFCWFSHSPQNPTIKVTMDVYLPTVDRDDKEPPWRSNHLGMAIQLLIVTESPKCHQCTATFVGVAIAMAKNTAGIQCWQSKFADINSHWFQKYPWVGTTGTLIFSWPTEDYFFLQILQFCGFSSMFQFGGGEIYLCFQKNASIIPRNVQAFYCGLLQKVIHNKKIQCETRMVVSMMSTYLTIYR